MDLLVSLRRRGPRAVIAGALALAGLPATAADWIYTVVDGDNLWDVSTRYLDTTLRYEQLRRLNNIERPRRMQPGTRIRVPMKWIRSNPARAMVAAIGGQATLMRQDGSQEHLDAAGAAIGLGDRLRTAAESSVAVRFADGSMVTLYEDSEMLFDHLSAHGETGMVDSRLRLIEGRLDTRVKPAVGPGSRFEIHTPSAISAVRGTAYRAATRESGRLSNIEVLEGRVAVAGASREGHGVELLGGVGVGVVGSQFVIHLRRERIYFAIVAGGGLLTAALSLWLIPQFGSNGAATAWSTCAATCTGSRSLPVGSSKQACTCTSCLTTRALKSAWNGVIFGRFCGIFVITP